MIKKILGRCIYWVGWPLVWIKVHKSRRSKVLLVCGKDILLVKNLISCNDDWTLPGGGAKGGEPDKVCASRELKEELSIMIDPVDFKELGAFDNKSHGYQYRVAVFAASCDKARKIKKSLEIRDYAWFEIKKLPANRRPMVDRAIALAKQG